MFENNEKIFLKALAFSASAKDRPDDIELFSQMVDAYEIILANKAKSTKKKTKYNRNVYGGI